MNSIVDIVKKNSNDFSFISTFFDLVGNKEFKQAEISTLYTNNETKETSFWRSLSAVSEQLGKEFYDNVLNFIDNICNVDLCKVQSLQSMITNLGIKYSVFNDIQNMPIEIQKLIDILSIKREYLINYMKMDKQFVNTMLSGITINTSNIDFNIDKEEYSNCVIDNDVLSDVLSNALELNEYRNIYKKIDNEISNYWNDDITYSYEIDDNKFRNFSLSVFNNFLNSKIKQTYNDKNETYIYKHLSNNILLSSFELENNKKEQIDSYKVLYNIPYTFNVQNEVDKYENDEVILSDYTQQEIHLLSIEIERRKEPFKHDELKTRYKFYRERELKEYTEFIQNEYSSSKLIDCYLSSTQYLLDKNFIEIHNTNNTHKLFHIKNNEISLSTNMIDDVSLQLTNIVFNIRNIREMLKTQCQQNYMKGTYEYIKFLIQEYFKYNIIDTLNDFTNSGKLEYNFENNKVDLIEYFDTTNYNNIKCDLDDYLSNNISNSELCSLNDKYWQTNNNFEAIGPINNTNIFNKLPTLSAENSGFGLQDLSILYLNELHNNFCNSKLKTKTQVQHLKDFLHTLYQLGADNTFLSNGIFHTYDSYELKKQYDEISAINLINKNNIENCFSKISTYIEQKNISVNQLLTLNEQILDLYNIAYDDQTNNKWQDNLNNVIELSNVLLNANELTSYIRLSSLVIEINDKYDYINYIKYSQYLNALETDSFEKQKEFETLSSNCELYYNNISIALQDASVYIPADFKQFEITLDKQISNLCLGLSSIENEEERIIAKTKVEKLSVEIYNANELTSEIELELILETLSANYELSVAEKQNEINEIRNNDVFKYRQQIFNQYTGNINGNTPYYYMENVRHPSFMLHPYLFNYVEFDNFKYPIENIYNLASEELSNTIINNISDFIDNDGYLINIWKNPINCNTDYISKYEHVDHLLNGIQLSTIGYDGLFYPPAVEDFIKTAEYTIDLTSKQYIDCEFLDSNNNKISSCTGTFIQSLSGINGTHTITGQHINVCYNPWYEHLNLSKNERLHITEQLTQLSNFIIEAATQRTIDIFRYGLDIYNNAYCLLKKYNSTDIAINDNLTFNDDIDFDTKLSTYGQLWIRLKNHPIALPAFTYERMDNTYCLCTNMSQITEEKTSNKEYNELCFSKLYNTSNTTSGTRNFYTPDICDFTFSYDKNIIVFNGKLSNNIAASYPIIANISQTYDAINECNNLKFNTVNNDSIFSVISENYLTSTIPDWIFQTYFFENTKIGVLYSHISSDINNQGIYENTIQICGAYYDYFDNTVKRRILSPVIVDTIIADNILENVCVDVHNNIVTIAYLDTLPSKLNNYINKEIDNLSSYTNLNSNNFVVKTKQYTIGEYTFLDINNERSYVSYTDIGFYGLIGFDSNSNSGSNFVNELGNTYLGKYELNERGVYKFQIISNPIENITDMIDFRYIVLPRTYETYKKDIIKTTKTPQGTEYKYLNYFDVHYYETLESKYTQHLNNYESISSDNYIYDPLEFRNILKNNIPNIKTYESNKFYNNVDNSIPYLLYLNKDEDDITSFNHFIQPYNQTTITKTDNCIFNLFESNVSATNISVSWCKYGEKDGEIQLDFNTEYYKANISVNDYNQYHLFLNLEKAGDAGILNIYKDPSDFENGYELITQYYIKNISDTKPKFLLSACNIAYDEYEEFLFESGTVFGNNTEDPGDDENQSGKNALNATLLAEGILQNQIVSEKTILHI